MESEVMGQRDVVPLPNYLVCLRNLRRNLEVAILGQRNVVPNFIRTVFRIHPDPHPDALLRFPQPFRHASGAVLCVSATLISGR